jgi:hypothetical protein
MMEVNLVSLRLEIQKQNSKQHLASSDHKFLPGPQIGKSSGKSVSECVCSVSEERRK